MRQINLKHTNLKQKGKIVLALLLALLFLLTGCAQPPANTNTLDNGAWDNGTWDTSTWQ
jgi:uncharacterized lipoprotein YajG